MQINDILVSDPYTSPGSVSYWYPIFNDEFCTNQTFLERCESGVLSPLNLECDCTTGKIIDWVLFIIKSFIKGILISIYRARFQANTRPVFPLVPGLHNGLQVRRRELPRIRHAHLTRRGATRHFNKCPRGCQTPGREKWTL